jgi:hypothetical protein
MERALNVEVVPGVCDAEPGWSGFELLIVAKVGGGVTDLSIVTIMVVVRESNRQ